MAEGNNITFNENLSSYNKEVNADEKFNQTSNESQNFTCGKWELTREQHEFQQLHGYWVQSVISIIVSICGSILNVVTIFILSNVELKRLFFNKLLICLTIFNTLYLINSVYESVRLHITGTNYCALEGYVLIVLHPVRKIVMCCSIYMTLVLTCERYLAVARPIAHRNRSIGSSEGKRTLKYVSPVILFSIIYCMPIFFSSMIQSVPAPSTMDSLMINETMNDTTTSITTDTQNETMFCLLPTDLRLSRHFILWYINVANFVVTGAIPFLSLAFLNCKIFQIIRTSMKEQQHLTVSRTVTATNGNSQKNQRAEEVKQAIVLFGIVIAFFVCHVLRIVVNIEEIITYEDWVQTEERARQAGKYCGGVQFWTMITTDVSHMLLQINASINFFIYCFFGKQFKKVLKDKLLRIAKCLRLVNTRWGSESSFGSRRTSVCRVNFISTQPGGQAQVNLSTACRTQYNDKNETLCQGRNKTMRKEFMEMQSFDVS